MSDQAFDARRLQGFVDGFDDVRLPTVSAHDMPTTLVPRRSDTVDTVAASPFPDCLHLWVSLSLARVVCEAVRILRMWTLTHHVLFQLRGIVRRGLSIKALRAFALSRCMANQTVRPLLPNPAVFSSTRASQPQDLSLCVLNLARSVSAHANGWACVWQALAEDHRLWALNRRLRLPSAPTFTAVAKEGQDAPRDRVSALTRVGS